MAANRPNVVSDYSWIYNRDEMNREELSELYRIAPLGEKPPDSLATVFANSMLTCFVQLQQGAVGHPPERSTASEKRRCWRHPGGRGRNERPSHFPSLRIRGGQGRRGFRGERESAPCRREDWSSSAAGLHPKLLANGPPRRPRVSGLAPREPHGRHRRIVGDLPLSTVSQEGARRPSATPRANSRQDWRPLELRAPPPSEAARPRSSISPCRSTEKQPRGRRLCLGPSYSAGERVRAWRLHQVPTTRDGVVRGGLLDDVEGQGCFDALGVPTQLPCRHRAPPTGVPLLLVGGRQPEG
jgi:hypothetical protein